MANRRAEPGEGIVCTITQPFETKRQFLAPRRTDLPCGVSRPLGSMDQKPESQELTSFTQMLADGAPERDTQSPTQDDRDMYRMGNTQQLQRNFHTLSILGLTCIVLTTWTAILASSTFSLINGGRAGSIYVYIGTWICTLPVTASLAEMASMVAHQPI